MANALNASDALKYPGQEYPFSMAVELPAFERSGDPVALDDIIVKGVIVGAGESVSLEARATALLRSRCVRCLEDVSLEISADISAMFARTPNPEDPDLYLFEGHTLDITDATRDALIMELPIKILCSANCNGLCPVCGANRNLTSCSCPRGGETANPFEALRAIVINDEEV